MGNIAAAASELYQGYKLVWTMKIYGGCSLVSHKRTRGP